MQVSAHTIDGGGQGSFSPDICTSHPLAKRGGGCGKGAPEKIAPALLPRFAIPYPRIWKKSSRRSVLGALERGTPGGLTVRLRGSSAGEHAVSGTVSGTMSGGNYPEGLLRGPEANSTVRRADSGIRQGDSVVRGAELAVRGADSVVRGADSAVRGEDLADRGDGFSGPWSGFGDPPPDWPNLE